VSRLVATIRGVILGIVVGTTLASSIASGEQPTTAARVGALMPMGAVAFEAGLREGLNDLGYVEGKNLIIEWRRYTQSTDVLQAAAADLVRLRVDVIVTNGTQAGRAALSATSTIPVVILSGDPVGGGLVTNLAHPGGNATGVSSQTTDLMAKRLQLLMQIAPRTRRASLLLNPDNRLHEAILEEAQKVARTLRIHVEPLDARNATELDAALLRIQQKLDDAFIVSSDVFFIVNKDKIADAVRKARLPALVPTKEYQGDGVLMSYGPSLKWTSRRAATYVDKILKGAKPGDLPIEQVSKFQLVIDLRAARELGIKVPQELLYRADEVIR